MKGPKPRIITLNKAVQLLSDQKLIGEGKVFQVTFVKRTTGEKRTMLARFDVKSYLKGGKAAYNPEEKQLMVVFDMQKLAYRSINLRDILCLTIANKSYVVHEV